MFWFMWNRLPGSYFVSLPSTAHSCRDKLAAIRSSLAASYRAATKGSRSRAADASSVTHRRALLPLRRLDVLVHVEQIARIVLRFHFLQPRIVAAITGRNPLLALVHQEVHIGTSRRQRMKRRPVVPDPIGIS